MAKLDPQPRKDKGHARRADRAAAAAIAAACVLCYAGTLGNEFVAGDVQFIVQNDAIKHLSVLATAFTKGYWWVGGGSDAGTYYRPLVVLLDAFDYLVSRGGPIGFHVTNTLLHAGASYLVYGLARLGSRSRVVALAAGLLFAVHPIHVYATAYISARTTLLCSVFYVGAVIEALRWRRAALEGQVGPPARGRHLLAVLACYVAALLSAETAATLPLVLAVVLWPTAGRRKAWLSELAWLVASGAVVTAAYVVVRRLALGGVLSQKESLWELLPGVPTALTIAKTYAYYAGKLVLPTELSYVPPFVPVLRAGDPLGLASLAGLLAALGVAVAGPARWGRERAALAWMLVTLLPVSGLLPLDHFVRGHYAYLPSVGFCVLVALLARRALRLAARRLPGPGVLVAFAGLTALGLVGFAVDTVAHGDFWQTSATLDDRVLALESQIPDAIFPLPVMGRTANRFAFVHYDVATTLAQQRRCESALPHYERAGWLTRQRSIRLWAQRGAAQCAFTTGDHAKALELYRALADAAPTDAVPPTRVAWIYLQRGDAKAALPYLGLACERGSAPACDERSRLAGGGGPAP